MTEVAVYENNVPAMPERVGVPGTQDFDSWVKVVVQVIKLADHICDTPFVPDGLRGSSPATAAAMLAGREMGLGPMTSLANIDVIRGRPAPKPVLMRGMVLSRGHKWVDVDVSDVRAVVRGCRKGEADWTEVTFTAQQAKTAGIDLGKYPADKLYARASSRLARRKFADVIMGMPYSADEIEDGEDENGAVPALAAGPAPAIEPPKTPRTAQRRTRQAAAEKAPDPPHAAAAPAVTAHAATAPDPDAPPFPGDEEPAAEEPDRDSPGTATVGKGGQLTALWTILRTEFGFTDDEKAQARSVCEQIIGRRLAGETTGDLSWNEARTVLDTLANWKSIAESDGNVEPREVMMTHLAKIAELRDASGDGAAGQAAAERAFKAGEAGG